MYFTQQDEIEKKKKKTQKLNHSNKIHRHLSDLPNKRVITDKWEMCMVC